MTQIAFGFGFATLTTFVVLIGDYVLKVAADGGRPMLSMAVVAGCVLYAVSALLWFFTMLYVSLSQAGVIYSMLTLLALVAIGALWFGEKIGTREIAGVGCALAAMVLMVRTD